MPSPTPNKALTYPANGADVNFWDTPVNANWNAIDNALGGLTTINVTGASGTVVLSAGQYTPPIITLTGTLTANVTYQFPTGVGGFWFVNNATSGAFSVTFSSGGAGSTTVAPQLYSITITCDGTNIRNIGIGPLQSPGSNTQMLYNSSGAIAAATGVITDGTNVTISGFLNLTGNLNLSGHIGTDVTVIGGAQTTVVGVAYNASSMTVNCLLSNVFYTVLTGNSGAPTISNPQDGQTINWWLGQDGTGGRVITAWPATFHFVGNVAPTLSTSPNRADLLVATYFGVTGAWLVTVIVGFV
jgi:hypothetical protein